MIELTHAIAGYRERLANEGSDYSGKWVLIKPLGTDLSFTLSKLRQKRQPR